MEKNVHYSRNENETTVIRQSTNIKQFRPSDF